MLFVCTRVCWRTKKKRKKKTCTGVSTLRACLVIPVHKWTHSTTVGLTCSGVRAWGGGGGAYFRTQQQQRPQQKNGLGKTHIVFQRVSSVTPAVVC